MTRHSQSRFAPNASIVDSSDKHLMHVSGWQDMTPMPLASRMLHEWRAPRLESNLRKVVDAVPLTQQPAVQTAVHAIVAAESAGDARDRPSRLPSRVPPTLSESKRAPQSQLGANDHVLRLAEGALASPHTTNVVEPPFAAVRIGASVAKRFQGGATRYGHDLTTAPRRRTARSKAQCVKAQSFSVCSTARKRLQAFPFPSDHPRKPPRDHAITLQLTRPPVRCKLCLPI